MAVGIVTADIMTAIIVTAGTLGPSLTLIPSGSQPIMNGRPTVEGLAHEFERLVHVGDELGQAGVGLAVVPLHLRDGGVVALSRGPEGVELVVHAVVGFSDVL